MLESFDLDVTVGHEHAVLVDFGVEVRVLLPALVLNRFLLVHIGSQGLNKANVALHARFIVVIHSSLLLCQTTERLLQVEELVLE